MIGIIMIIFLVGLLIILIYLLKLQYNSIKLSKLQKMMAGGEMELALVKVRRDRKGRGKDITVKKVALNTLQKSNPELYNAIIYEEYNNLKMWKERQIEGLK